MPQLPDWKTRLFDAIAPSLTGRIGLHSLPYTPDSIMQSELTQLLPENWDQQPAVVLGRVAGKIRNVADMPVIRDGETVIFRSAVQTQFVRVQLEDGTERMEPYLPGRHGPWGDIPDTGELPGELLEQLTGFGVEIEDQGQQFRNVRKRHGGASRIHWPPKNHPRPKR